MKTSEITLESVKNNIIDMIHNEDNDCESVYDFDTQDFEYMDGYWARIREQLLWLYSKHIIDVSVINNDEWHVCVSCSATMYSINTQQPISIEYTINSAFKCKLTKQEAPNYEIKEIPEDDAYQQVYEQLIYILERADNFIEDYVNPNNKVAKLI